MVDKIKVGILRGGTGKYYSSSLKKGGDLILHIFENLSDKYNVVDILIDKEGNWHNGGVPIVPTDLMRKIDIAWDISDHNNSSIILNNLSIVSTEDKSFFRTLNNNFIKEHVKDIGIKMPKSILLPLYQEDIDARPTEDQPDKIIPVGSFGQGSLDKYITKKAQEVLSKFSAPWIIKSYTSDSNTRPTEWSFGQVGIHLAKTFPELMEAIRDGIIHKKSILIEEFILGKVGGVHSITSFRGEDIYTLLPENFSSNEKEKIISTVKDLHEHLGIKNYLKSNFILHPKRGIFITEIDIIPDTRKGSHLEQSCESFGIKMHYIVEHIIENTLNK